MYTMSQQGTFADFGGSSTDQPSAQPPAVSSDSTPTDDRARRKAHAESLRESLADLDGVEEAIIDDATPSTWECVAFAVSVKGETVYATPTKTGFRIADDVDLRSLSQRLNYTIDSDENVSMFTVVDRPEKVSRTAHDSQLYLIDAWFP